MRASGAEPFAKNSPNSRLSCGLSQMLKGALGLLWRGIWVARRPKSVNLPWDFGIKCRCYWQECVLNDRERKLLSSYPIDGDCFGCSGCAWAIAPDAIARGIVRHELSYLSRFSLCTSLVQPLERKVVRRIFPDHISAADPPVDRARLQCCRAEDGVYAGPARSGTAA